MTSHGLLPSASEARAGVADDDTGIAALEGNAASLRFHPLLLRATHVFYFDAVFSQSSRNHLLPILLCRPSDERRARIICTCSSLEDLSRMYDPDGRHPLSAYVNELDSNNLHTNGNFTRKIHIYQTTQPTNLTPPREREVEANGSAASSSAADVADAAGSSTRARGKRKTTATAACESKKANASAAKKKVRIVNSLAIAICLCIPMADDTCRRIGLS